MSDAKASTFHSARPVAMRLGVPVAWLLSEAKEGRISHLKAGRRILFNIEIVERELRGRAIGERQASHA